jgi:acyl-CoA synthetase (AMP-forming)/AMP-acid ligase II
VSNRVYLDGAWRPFDELVDEALAARIRAGGLPVLVLTTGVADAWRAGATIATRDLDAGILDAGRFDAAMGEHVTDAGYGVLDGPQPAAPAPVVDGRVTILTSGTTGLPTLVPKSLRALRTMDRVGGQPARRWLCPFAAGTYAWFQVLVMGLSVPGQDVVPVLPADAEGWLRTARAAGVDALSATPTFWRRALFNHTTDELRGLPLAQLTLGGEPVEQDLLDALRDLYPDARLTHIYASSEAGSRIVVHDGRAGFPVAWLEPDAGRGLRVDGDRLLVAVPDAPGGWLETGDHVRIAGDRVIVTGRAPGAVANVGGVKVSLEQVREVLLAHEAVVWASVTARRAALVGELPVAKVVLAAGATATRDELRAFCAERLQEAAVPRLVTILDGIPTTDALKAAVPA